MSEVAVIGEHPIVVGFALAGARVHPAYDPVQVRTAWESLPTTVGIVILTPTAAEALPEPSSETEPLRVVMPL